MRKSVLFNFFFGFFIDPNKHFVNFSHVSPHHPDFAFTVFVKGALLTKFPVLHEALNGVEHKSPLLVTELTVLPKRVKANRKFDL
jgi:hypothetical protein